MQVDAQRFRPPSIGILRWLVDPGPHVPALLYERLLSRLFSGTAAVIMGVLNSILVSSAALCIYGRPIFAVFVATDLVLSVVRLHVIRLVQRAIANGCDPPVDAYILTGLMWCGLQGAIAFEAMQTDHLALEVLATTQIFGIIGPICARNYPAPRYALLLVCLCDLPFVMGSLLSGNRWLLFMVPETPIFLFGCYKVVQAFQHLATESLKAEWQSHRNATHDPLTGLLNRRGMAESIPRLGQAGEACLCVLALDLDGFKTVNDTLGHHVGDALLKAVADRLTARVRPSESVVRLGGDEFVVIAADLSPAVAAKLAERLLAGIAQTPFLINGEHSISVGVSIGLACAPEDGDGIDLLHRRADAALYVAKASGKGVCRRYMSGVEDRRLAAPTECGAP